MPPTEQVRSTCSGEARWFAEEVQPHEAALRTYLRRQYPKLTDVDDMVQESFVRLLRARKSGHVGCVRAYLFSIARNAANAMLRRPRIIDDTPHSLTAMLRVVETDADVVETVSTRQEIGLLLNAIDALPARCREIFILRKLQGVPQKEIAQRLGLSEQTIQVQVGRGAKKCADFLRRRGVTGRNAPSNIKTFPDAG